MQKKVTLFIWMLTLLALLLAAFLYPNITQDQIPTHWDFQGNVNGYSPKWMFFVLPCLILFLDTLVCITRKVDPKSKNYQKFDTGYQWFRICLGVILFVISCSVSIETIYPDTIDIKTIATLCISFLFIVIGNMMPQIRQNYTMGVKTPWALYDETVWIKTHRFTGRLWFACGILFLLVLYLPEAFATIYLLALLFLCILLPYIYSYIIYKQKHAKGE